MTSDYYPTDFSEDFEEISNINNTITIITNKIIKILHPYSLLLKQKILLQVSTKLGIIRRDYKTIEIMISNLSKSLQIANLKEHQSGWFRSIVKAVSGNNTKNAKVAAILGIHRKSVLAAKQQQNNLPDNKYNQFVQKTTIKRVRIDPKITEQIHQWMKTAFTASSNSSNVIQKKKNNVIQWEVKHWRTETIEELYEMFCQQFEGSENEFKIGYFRKLIPWFVRKRINYSGLCIKHDMGLYYIKLLVQYRKDWHINHHTCVNRLYCKCKSTCNCQCQFCTTCDHGSTPSIGRNCFDNTCSNCCYDECPLEFTELKQVKWIERFYDKIDGRLQPIDDEVITTRMYMIQRITHELQIYQDHLKHLIQWKKSYQELKDNLQSHHIIVRWDFIGNFFMLFILNRKLCS